MVQTITVRADSSVCVNTGTHYVEDGLTISNELQVKFDDLVSALTALGGSEVHSEKDDFRQFEHLVKSGEVIENDFGTTISSSDFEWIVNHIDAVHAQIEAEAIARAAAAAEAEAEASATEPEPT